MKTSNRASILVILISNWVWFLHLSVELGVLSVFLEEVCFASLSIRPTIKAIHNTLNKRIRFLSFITIIYITDNSWYGRRSRKLKHSEIMNLGRLEIGYNSKGQVINRVDKSQILVLNEVGRTALANFHEIQSIVCEAK